MATPTTSLPINNFRYVNMTSTPSGSTKLYTSLNASNLSKPPVTLQDPAVESPKPLLAAGSSTAKILVSELEKNLPPSENAQSTLKSPIPGPSVTSNPKTKVDGAMSIEQISGPSTSDQAGPTPNVFPAHQTTPLFLPSPTSSHISDSVSPSPPLTTKDKGKGRADAPRPASASESMANKRGPKSNMVFTYVLVPPLPEYAKRWKTQKARPGKSAQEDELDTIEVYSGSRMEDRLRSPSLGDFSARSPSTPPVPAKVLDLIRGGESGTEGVL